MEALRVALERGEPNAAVREAEDPVVVLAGPRPRGQLLVFDEPAAWPQRLAVVQPERLQGAVGEQGPAHDLALIDRQVDWRFPGLPGQACCGDLLLRANRGRQEQRK